MEKMLTLSSEMNSIQGEGWDKRVGEKRYRILGHSKPTIKEMKCWTTLIW